jgi:hypothetical protein
VAVDHKATEGRNYKDKEYAKRKSQFKSAGFLLFLFQRESALASRKLFA